MGSRWPYQDFAPSDRGDLETTMKEKEVKTVAKFLEKAIKITMNISDQFNVLNFSASPKDDFCNHFRVADSILRLNLLLLYHKEYRSSN